MSSDLLDAVDGRKVLYELVNTPPLAVRGQRAHPLRVLRPRPDRSARAAPDQGPAQDRRRQVRVTLRWLVTGAGGMVGHDVCAALESRGETVLPLTKSDLDITDAPAVREAVRRAKPDVIVNCAAYTKVDDAETNEHLATAINGSAVEFLADAANDVDALLVQISTDFVFDGSKRTPYEVNDPTGAAIRVRPLETDRRTGRDASRGSTSSSAPRGCSACTVRTSSKRSAIRSAKERTRCAWSTISADGRPTRRISPMPSFASRSVRTTTRRARHRPLRR